MPRATNADESDRIRTVAMLRAHHFLNGSKESAADPCEPRGGEPYHSALCLKLRGLFEYVIGLEERLPPGAIGRPRRRPSSGLIQGTPRTPARA